MKSIAGINHCFRFDPAVVLCLTMAMVVSSARAADRNSKQPLVANEQMQRIFTELVNANDQVERERIWNQLQQFDRSDRQGLIQQLALFAGDAKGVKASMIPGAVIGQFKMTEGEVIHALIPLLETENERLVKQTKGMLAEFEDQTASRPPDFSIYREIITAELREGREAPTGLVKHMYDVSPGTALLTMMRASQMRDPEKLREILWAEHVVSESDWKRTHGFIARDAVETQVEQQLRQMANHQYWWARFYVVATMKSEPLLKSPELLDMLSSDSNTVVASEALRLRQ